MPQLKEFTFPSCDGEHTIYVRQWNPDGEVRAVVQIAHGVAEHIRRYDEFMEYLAERGFVVAGNDHLGHGWSVRDETELGYFGEEDGWSKVVGDLHRLHCRLKKEYPGVPVFLFGHSMGSFLARTYATMQGEDLDGLIVCGTGHQPKSLVLSGGAAAKLEIALHGAGYHSQLLNDMAFGSYNKGFAPARTKNDWLSRDETIVDAYTADPLCGYIPTAGLFYELMRGIGYVTTKKNIRRMPKDLPVLFVSGAEDPVGENGKGVLRAYLTFMDVGMEDVTMRLFEKDRHEILNELDKEDVYAYVLAWLEKYV